MRRNWSGARTRLRAFKSTGDEIGRIPSGRRDPGANHFARASSKFYPVWGSEYVGCADANRLPARRNIAAIPCKLSRDSDIIRRSAADARRPARRDHSATSRLDAQCARDDRTSRARWSDRARDREIAARISRSPTFARDQSIIERGRPRDSAHQVPLSAIALIPGAKPEASNGLREVDRRNAGGGHHRYSVSRTHAHEHFHAIIQEDDFMCPLMQTERAYVKMCELTRVQSTGGRHLRSPTLPPFG